MPRPSLIVAPQHASAAQHHRLAGWLGLLLVALLLVVISYGDRPSATVESLDEGWIEHRMAADGHMSLTPIELPAVWSNRKAQPAETFASVHIVATGVPMALWVDRPRHAVSVVWDGLPVGHAGRTPGGAAAPTILALPTAARGTVHELGLEIHGAYGESGIGGEIRIGPVADVYEVAAAARVRAMAIAFGLAMLAGLPLAVASRGPWRPAYSLYGFVAIIVAVDLWAQSPQPAQLGIPLGWELAIGRSTRWLVCTLEIAFFTAFIHGAPGRAATRFLGVGAAGAFLTMLAPAPAAWWARVAGDIVTIVAFAWGLALTRQAMHKRVEGRWLIAAALGAGCVSFVTEASLYNGLRSGSSYATLTIVILIVCQGAALLIRDAGTSERHERLLERFPDPLITVDGQGTITDANPAALALFPGTPHAAAGTPLIDLLMHHVHADHHPRMRGHLRRGLVRTDHIEFRSPQGRWYESAATPVADDRVLIDLRDITARRDLDRGMLQAAKAETTGLLLGGLAHDFNNMLGTLLAHVGILKLRDNADEVVERLRRMESSIERAASLTKRLLTVSRGTGNTLKACDLRSVCQGAVELVEPTLGQVALTVQIEDDLPPVHGDAEDLEQVLVNLLVNARDAVGTTGTIRLVARRFQLADGAKGVAAMVEDDGPGVAEAVRSELFQPFVTTKTHGTGLGLAIARQILADHLGRLWYEPSPTGGARFLMALRHADAVDEAPAPLPEHRRILLVDDEEVLLEAWQSALSSAGYEVVATPDPVEAITLLRDDPPDMLITDLAMTPLSGLEVARAARVYAPTAPVLIVSAFIAPDIETQLASNGWDALTKPIRAARLVAAVGHLRRQAERQAAGVDDITSVMHLFPTLEVLSAESLGFTERQPS